MHEMSLCLSMVDLLSERLRAEKAEKVLRVRVEVGAFGHVEPEALAFCFDSAARGTPVEGAELRIDLRPGQAFCFDCEQSVILQQRLDPCPYCSGYRLRIDGGDQLRVTEMEVI